jgi:predicted RNase H-like HicB family nuclease
VGRVTAYFTVAMKMAVFEAMEDNEGWFGAIVEFDGLWATAPTESECRVALRSALEERVLTALQHHAELPVMGQIDLNHRHRH